MGAESGPKPNWTGAPLSFFPCQQEGKMTGFESVEILLVEDNPTDAELTMRALRKKNLANNLVWVKDGVEALDFIFCKGQYRDRINGTPKLIMLDLKLPKIDGIEVLRTIKSDAKTKSVPVVMLTSSNEERDIVESYQLGVNSYIVKPVDFDKFLEMVSQVGLYWSLVNKVPHAV
jgi:CheY-like chemotaxis protein